MLPLLILVPIELNFYYLKIELGDGSVYYRLAYKNVYGEYSVFNILLKFVAFFVVLF